MTEPRRSRVTSRVAAGVVLGGLFGGVAFAGWSGAESASPLWFVVPAVVGFVLGFLLGPWGVELLLAFFS